MAKASVGEQKKRILDTDLIELLNSPHCTAPRIQELLEDAQKRDKKVNKSAKDKETLIKENLRRAVAEGAVPIESVFALLADCEENDSQYHFFYAVDDLDLQNSLSNFQKTGDSLFGSAWKSEQKFPNFLAKPRGEQWGDFRQEGGTTEKPGWVLKLYRGDNRWVLDVEQSKSTTTRRVKVWVPEYTREVWLVRWYPEDSLLELCLPRLGNRAEQFDARDALWATIQKIVSRNAVVEFFFDEAATSLVHDDGNLGGAVHLGGQARLMSEDGGSTVMMPRSSQQGLRDAEDRREALKHFKNCRELCVFWLETKATDAIKDDTKTITGFWGARNSILFTARNSGKTVRYVTKRFIELELKGRKAKG